MYRGVASRGKALVYADVAAADGKGGSRITALIDTGATVTGVSQNVVRRLGLLPINNDKHIINTAGGNVGMRTYKVAIRLIGNNNAKSGAHVMDIVGLPFASHDFDMLLGTDILSRCCFISRGREFFLGFDTDGEKTLQAAKDFLAPKKRGAARA